MSFVAPVVSVFVMLLFLSGSAFVFRARAPRSPANHALRWAALIATGVNGMGLAAIPARLSLVQCAAIGLQLLAIALWLCARHAIRARHFGVALAPDVPERLVVHGPFRWVRHPFYVAYILGWGGIAGVVQTWPSIVAGAVMIAFYASAAHLEERRLAASSLAAEHARYRARVGMFVPKFWTCGRDTIRRAAPGGAA